MSWAAHEFENYLVQRHLGVKVSFFAIVLGTQAPDLFTKFFVYRADDAAAFQRGWPGVGFTHSLAFGVALGLVVLAVTRRRPWALGLVVGQWAHVLTDLSDSAGVMLFFPFSTEPVAFGVWKHAASVGAVGDATAYYSSFGVIWDAAWLAAMLLVARRALTTRYFRTTIVPADPKVWLWLHRRLRLSPDGMLLVYRGLFFYGFARMTVWFIYARLVAASTLRAPVGRAGLPPAGERPLRRGPVGGRGPHDRWAACCSLPLCGSDGR